MLTEAREVRSRKKAQGRCRGRGREGPEDHGDNAADPGEERGRDDVAPRGAGDVADEAAGSDASGGTRSDGSLDLGGDDLDLDHDRYWEVKAEWEHSVADVPVVATGIRVEPGDHSGSKFFEAETDEQLGTLTVMRAGTPQECLSVYCRLHQCKNCVTFRKLPSELALRRWFADGLALGRGEANQAQHKSHFPMRQD